MDLTYPLRWGNRFVWPGYVTDPTWWANGRSHQWQVMSSQSTRVGGVSGGTHLLWNHPACLSPWFCLLCYRGAPVIQGWGSSGCGRAGYGFSGGTASRCPFLTPGAAFWTLKSHRRESFFPLGMFFHSLNGQALPGRQKVTLPNAMDGSGCIASGPFIPDFKVVGEP